MKPSTTPVAPENKLPKGHFRCFQCRKVIPNKDGDWYHWDSMEVHLCKGCEETTRSKKERKNRK